MKKYIFGILALIAIASTVIFFNTRDVSYGSAVGGNDYNYYHASSSVATPVILKTGFGSMAQVTIASSSAAGSLKIYDNAVSTSSATSTRIVSFPAGAAAGTYTFDLEFTRGLVLDVPPGFNGSYVVTWR